MILWAIKRPWSSWDPISRITLHKWLFIRWTSRRLIMCLQNCCAPHPSHNVFFFQRDFGWKFSFFLSVCMVKMELKVHGVGWCYRYLGYFPKERALSSSYTWSYCAILALEGVVYNCLMEPDLEIAGGLLLDLSSGLESFWVSPKYHTTPTLKLEASQSLKCDGSLTLRSSQTSKPMKLSFLGYRKKNCCNSGCKFFWLSLTYCRLEKLLDSSSSSSLSRSILCLFSAISCVFATCVAVYNYKTTMFQSKRKKKA